MRGLVTGATGTVGSAVVRRLVGRRRRVRALVRRPGSAPEGAEEAVADLSDREALDAALKGVRWVVHCAAYLGDDWAESLRTNVEGTRALVDAASRAGCRRFVHLSTVSVYDWRRTLAFDESSALWTEKVDPYGFSKAEAERIVRASHLRWVVLRPVVVLSMHPRSTWGPLAIRRARTATGPLVPTANMPYVHVDNLVEAVVLALDPPVVPDPTWDVVDGDGDARAYVAAVERAIGRPLPPVPPDAPQVTVRGLKIRRELGYTPIDRWREFLEQLAAAGPAQ